MNSAVSAFVNPFISQVLLRVAPDRQSRKPENPLAGASSDGALPYVVFIAGPVRCRALGPD
jgi:hypothetical protein